MRLRSRLARAARRRWCARAPNRARSSRPSTSPRASGARLLADNDLVADAAAGDELIVRRVQFADGRTRAFINDQPVSVQVLRALGAALVEIHGQHDDRAFVEAATHRALLDAFGGLDDAAAEVRRHCGNERRAREAAVERIAPKSSAPAARRTGCATRSMSSGGSRRRRRGIRARRAARPP